MMAEDFGPPKHGGEEAVGSSNTDEPVGLEDQVFKSAFSNPLE